MGYWPDFNLESVFIFKNIFNMKNVTDFRKTVEAGVDPPIESKHHLLTLVKREPICFSLQQAEVNGPCHASRIVSGHEKFKTL